MIEPSLALSALVAAGAAAAVVGRYIFKIEGSFAQQRVINAKTVGALELIAEKLNGHEQVDDTREGRVERIETRVEHLEQQVALHR